MNNFDDFLSKARNLASAAGKMTGEMVETSRLKLQAVSINGEIQKAYERLGAIKYEQEKTGTDNSDLMDVCISEIDALFVSLNEINDRIADAKYESRCRNCGASNPAEATYCARCGSSLWEEYEADEEPVEQEAAQTESAQTEDEE